MKKGLFIFLVLLFIASSLVLITYANFLDDNNYTEEGEPGEQLPPIEPDNDLEEPEEETDGELENALPGTNQTPGTTRPGATTRPPTGGGNTGGGNTGNTGGGNTGGGTNTPAASTNNNLSAFSVNGLSSDRRSSPDRDRDIYAFTPGNQTYNLSVLNSVSTINITANRQDSTATRIAVTINGAPVSTVNNANFTGNISLVEGINTIRVEVTAQSGAPRTYTLVVNRFPAQGHTTFSVERTSGMQGSVSMPESIDGINYTITGTLTERQSTLCAVSILATRPSPFLFTNQARGYTLNNDFIEFGNPAMAIQRIWLFPGSGSLQTIRINWGNNIRSETVYRFTFGSISGC